MRNIIANNRLLGVMTTLVCALGLSSNAQALYSIGNLKNDYGTPITYNVPVATGSSAGFVYGNFSISVPGQGTVSFTDIASSKPSGCTAPTWGVIVTYQGNSWGFYYEGGGKLDVTIKKNGALGLTAVNGKVFDSGPCSQK